MQRHPGADVERSSQLGGHRGVRVDPPQLALPGVRAGAAGEDLGHHRQLARTRSVLRTRPPARSINQRRISQRRQVSDPGNEPSNILSNLLGHADRTTTNRTSTLPVDERATVDNCSTKGRPYPKAEAAIPRWLTHHWLTQPGFTGQCPGGGTHGSLCRCPGGGRNPGPGGSGTGGHGAHGLAPAAPAPASTPPPSTPASSMTSGYSSELVHLRLLTRMGDDPSTFNGIPV